MTMRLVGASFFVASRTVKNRILFAVRRLKRPRYLFSAIVSLLYFGMIFSRNRVLRGNLNMHPMTAQHLEAALAFATCGAFLLLLVPWAWPTSTSGGVFTETEIQFLFPAPLKRRDLMIYRQIRNLWGLLVSVLVIRFFGRSTTLIGTGILFLCLDPYMTFVRAARSRLKEIGIGFWIRFAVVLAILAGTVWYVVAPIRSEMQRVPLGGPGIQRLVWHAIEGLPSQWMFLLPRTVALAAVSRDATTVALNGALVFLLGLTAFLLAAKIDTSYEEASIGRSRAKSAMSELSRAQRRGQRVVARSLPAPFRLKDHGPPAVAIFWKNLIAAGRVYIAQLSILVVVLIPFLLMNLFGHSFKAVAMSIMGILVLTGSGTLLLIGANMFRNDLRGDLQKLEVIRTYPLSGPAIIAAEVAAPAAILTILLLVFVGGGGLFLVINGLVPGSLYGLALTAVILLGVPLLVVQLLIHNAWALLLPGWSFAGKEDNRGFAATGQGILILLGQLLILSVALIPGAIAFFLSFGLFRLLLHFTVTSAVSLSLIIPSALLVMEIYGAVQWLGHRFEELDLANDDLAPGS